jgi:hypothetical protein
MEEREEGGEGGAKSHDGQKTWSFINHSMLSGHVHLPTKTCKLINFSTTHMSSLYNIFLLVKK